MSAFVVIFTAMLALLTPVSIERWSGGKPVVGELEQLDRQGAQVRTAASPLPVTVPWYDLKSMEPSSALVSSYDDYPLRAWRAHARARRGDYAAALPMYESMRDEYLWYVGAQSMDLSIGLKRCLLAEGHRLLAIEPSLAWFVAARLHGPSDTSPEPSVDARMMLHVDLPPIGTVTERGFALPELPDTPTLTDRERLLHAYFRLVLDRASELESQLDQIEEIKRSLEARDPGLVLFEQVAFAQAHPDPSKRIAARDSLRRRAQTQQGSWIEAWARLGVGASLLRESDAIARDEGVIELLHVVVRLSDIDPNLTLLAARLASAHLEDSGHTSWAAQIMLDARTSVTNPNASQEYLSND